MRLVFIALLLLATGLTSIRAQSSTPDAAIITMELPLRLHSLPSLQTDTTAVVQPGTALTLTERTQDGEWLDVNADGGQSGWMMAEFADVYIDLDALPVFNDFAALPQDPPEFTPAVIKRIRKIFQSGQALGNRADAFSKVGDSITAAPHFLTPIGEGQYNLGDYQYLQGIINDFLAGEGRDGNSSFDNLSLTAGVGWPAHAAVDSHFADPSLCEPGESPLVCEYRLMRPAFALIMFGTNDVSRFDADLYKGNLQQIVQTSIEMGVIPIISTIPNRVDFEDQVSAFNAVIHETAVRFSIPLWDFYTVSQTLPGGGLSPDGIHLTIPPHGERGSADFRAANLYYGYVMRNLTALQMLDAVQRVLDEPAPSD